MSARFHQDAGPSIERTRRRPRPGDGHGPDAVAAALVNPDDAHVRYGDGRTRGGRRTAVIPPGGRRGARWRGC